MNRIICDICNKVYDIEELTKCKCGKWFCEWHGSFYCEDCEKKKEREFKYHQQHYNLLINVKLEKK